MDMPSPDNPAHSRASGNDSPNHKILLGAEVVLVEYLCNLRSLSKPVVELVVLPLKVKGADGAPARCIAIER
jgi:kynurenine formamidase